MNARSFLPAALMSITVLLAGCAASSTWAVHGTVAGDGTAEGCTVTLHPEHGDDVVVPTDSASKFAATDLPQGNYQVSAECGDASSPAAGVLVDSNRYVQLQLADIE